MSIAGPTVPSSEEQSSVAAIKMQALQKRTAQNTMKNAIAPKQTVRAPVSALPKLVPAVAPVSRARCTTEIRRLASAIVLQATGNGSSATQETTTKPLPIVFVAAEVGVWLTSECWAQRHQTELLIRMDSGYWD